MGPNRYRRLGGALAGVVSAAAGVAVGELIAAATRPDSSPIVAVGGALIDATPTPLKEFAVRTVGTYDKPLLLAGIGLGIAVFAAVVGILGTRRRRFALIGMALFGVAGAGAALSRPTSQVTDVLPTLLAAAVGAGVLLFLLARIRRSLAVDQETPEPVVPQPAAPNRAVLDPVVPPTDRPLSTNNVMARLTPTADPEPAPAEPAEPLAAERMPAGTRRQFLLAAAAVVGATAVTGGGTELLRGARTGAAARSRDSIKLPTPASPATRLPAGVGPDFFTGNPVFYRVDTALNVPKIDVGAWRLRVHGLVDRPLELSFADLLDRPLIERDITLNCVSNEVGGPYVGTARWLGVPLAPLLREVGVRAGSDQLVAHSIDGMTIGTPVDTIMDGRDAMLVVGMNGEPLPLEHGFPVRMLTPGLYGYAGACKWLTELELSTFDSYDAYWVKRGWAPRAPAKTASRIDAPKPFAQVAAGPTAIAGVAWAQHRGISQVEVQIDTGAWQKATLLPVPSSDTWVQWRYNWTSTPGSHTIRVRATDATGAVQTDQRATPFPNGATGWHNIVITVA